MLFFIACWIGYAQFAEHEARSNKSLLAVTNRYKGLKVKYVIPSDGPEFDFTKVEDGTLTIVYENGTRRTYSGVYVNKVGGETYKDGSETVRDVELSAEARDPE